MLAAASPPVNGGGGGGITAAAAAHGNNARERVRKLLQIMFLFFNICWQLYNDNTLHFC